MLYCDSNRVDVVSFHLRCAANSPRRGGPKSVLKSRVRNGIFKLTKPTDNTIPCTPVSIIGTDMRCSTYLFGCYTNPVPKFNCKRCERQSRLCGAFLAAGLDELLKFCKA